MSPNTPILLLFLALFTLGVQSQPKEIRTLSNYKHTIVRLSDSDPVPHAPQTSLFNHFEILDERPDTARIGLHFRYSWDSYRQIDFDHPVRQELAAYFDKHFARPDAPYTAVIVLRKLWLSNVYYFNPEDLPDQNAHLEKIRVRLRAEVYAARNGVYTPVLRFDSVAIALSSSNNRWANDLVGMLNDLADSATRMTARKAGKGRSLRLEEIEQFNHSRFSLPADTNNAPIRGVYASFNEFRNNNPSIHDFLVREIEDKTRLYTRNAAGEMTYSSDAWGYCDGKDFFVMKDGILHRTWREGKAYYFWYLEEDGSFSRKNRSSFSLLPPRTGPHATQDDFGKVDCIFAVDMDTGGVY